MANTHFAKVSARLVFLGLLVISICSLGHGATYYVSPKGNNRKDGASPATAWRTIQTAVSRVAPGDIVIIADGRYKEMVRLDALAQGEEPITFRAENSRRAVITGGHYCFGTDSVTPQNVILEGLKLSGGGMGLGFMFGANNLTIRNCEISGMIEGIRITHGQNLLIEDCFVHNNVSGILIGIKNKWGVQGVLVERTVMATNADPGGGGNRDGIVVENPSTGVIIRDCVASGSGDAGYDLKPDGSIVERCQGHGNGGWAIKLWGSDCLVTNCLMYGNVQGGIGSAGDRVQIWNCTFGPGRRSLRLETQDPASCLLRNNIFYDARLQCLAAGLPDEDYNCYFSSTNAAVISTVETAFLMDDVANHVAGLGQHDIARDPLFTNLEKMNFGLSSDSPCLGAGLWDPLIELDLLGETRTDPPDLGAVAG